MKFKKVRVTQEMKEEANLRVSKETTNTSLPSEAYGSSAESKYIGFIGELAVSQLFNSEIINHYEYDLIIEGSKVDVKTVACNSDIRTSYEIKVNSPYEDRMRPQKTDYYFFVRLDERTDICYVMGYMKSEDFWNEDYGYISEKGEKIAAHLPPNYARCKVGKISDLQPFK